MRVISRLIAVALMLCAGLTTTPLLAAKPLNQPDRTAAIDVVSRPFHLDRDDPKRKTFGKLKWRGGLILSSPNRHFGGFSGLELSPEGDRLLAVSDAGVWLEANIERDSRMLRRLREVRLGPILALSGKNMPRVRDIDAEALTVSGENAWIGFEQNHRIMRHGFTWKTDGPGRALKRIAPPHGFGAGRGNAGFEALAVLTAGPNKGRLVAFSESRVDRNGAHKGWMLGGAKPQALALRQIGGFSITGLAALPDGGIAVLERRFRLSEGIKMRIRRIAPQELVSGRLIEGETLIALDGRAVIDNMEAIAAHRSAEGETILTVLSDDNYNRLFQRTLLMAFSLPE